MLHLLQPRGRRSKNGFQPDCEAGGGNAGPALESRLQVSSVEENIKRLSVDIIK